LNLFRALTALRRKTIALSVGSYHEVETPHADSVLAYERRAAGSRVLVALNTTGREQTLDLSAARPKAETLVSTELDRDGVEELRQLRLRANEGLVMRIV
jgi:glycosidase